MKLRSWTRLLPPFLLMSLFGGVALSVIPNPAPIRFTFAYPTNAMHPSLFFILHGASNVIAPTTNWPVDAVYSATNFYSNNVCIAPVSGTDYSLGFTHNVIPAQRFWYMTASNWWGEADFLNVLAIEPPPARTGTLKAERAW